MENQAIIISKDKFDNNALVSMNGSLKYSNIGKKFLNDKENIGLYNICKTIAEMAIAINTNGKWSLNDNMPMLDNIIETTKSVINNNGLTSDDRYELLELSIINVVFCVDTHKRYKAYVNDKYVVFSNTLYQLQEKMKNNSDEFMVYIYNKL